MKIKVMRNLGKGWPSYKENEVVDADDAVAEKLIQACLAEPIKTVPKSPILKGVPKTERTVKTEATAASVPPKSDDNKPLDKEPKT